MVFITSHQPPEILQPRNRTFDFPAFAVTSQRSTILRPASLAVPFVRTDQLDAPFPAQPFPQRIAVGRFVINQPRRIAVRQHGAIQQRFDQCHFTRRGTMDVGIQRSSVAVNEQHDFGSLAPFGGADVFAPFFAAANVPSAIPSDQSSSRRRSSSSNNRAQAIRKTPDSVHCLNRRQHVVKEGKDFGKSFHRAPLMSTHKIPSKQARGGAGGRPPHRVVGSQGKRSSLRSHCSRHLSNRLMPGSCVERSVLAAERYCSRERNRFSIGFMVKFPFRRRYDAILSPNRSLILKF